MLDIGELKRVRQICKFYSPNPTQPKKNFTIHQLLKTDPIQQVELDQVSFGCTPLINGQFVEKEGVKREKLLL